MIMKTNMAGLMRWHCNNPRKRLDGYFIHDGKEFPTDIVEKIVKGEIVPKKGGGV